VSPRCTCAACGRRLDSKGHYTATFRSLFGDVPIRVRRLLTCPCHNGGKAKSIAAVDLEAATVAPELACVTPRPADAVVVGFDGGYVRSRHRQDERHFEVIAGKVIGAQGSQSRFAFARNSPAIASGAFKQALAMAGVTADTSATVLCDGDAGLWRLQRETLPNATVVLDWWRAAGTLRTRATGRSRPWRGRRTASQRRSTNSTPATC
jgi:hypothetical protein